MSVAGGMKGTAGRVVDALVGLGDLERGITRSLHGTASPADFSGMLRALSNVAPKLGVKVRIWKQPFALHTTSCNAVCDLTLEFSCAHDLTGLGSMVLRCQLCMLVT